MPTDGTTTCFFPCLQSESRLESTFANGSRHPAWFVWHSLDSLQLPRIKLFPLLSVQRLGTCKQQETSSDASHSTPHTDRTSAPGSSRTLCQMQAVQECSQKESVHPAYFACNDYTASAPVCDRFAIQLPCCEVVKTALIICATFAHKTLIRLADHSSTTPSTLKARNECFLNFPLNPTT